MRSMQTKCITPVSIYFFDCELELIINANEIISTKQVTTDLLELGFG